MHLRGHANLWFQETLVGLAQTGEKHIARGRGTREWPHVTTQLPDPRRRVLSVPYRRANPFFQVAETIWMLAGRSAAAWILHYNSQLARYLDDDSDHFHGAYGERLRHWGRHARSGVQDTGQDQFRSVLQELRQD